MELQRFQLALVSSPKCSICQIVCPPLVGVINSPEFLTWTTGVVYRSNSRRTVIEETRFQENYELQVNAVQI